MGRRTILTRVAGVYKHDTTTGPFSLVRRVLYELIPSRIRDALGQMMIFQESLSIQILQSNEVIGIDEASGNLMGYVPPLVRPMLMGFRKTTDSFLAPPTALLLPGHGALQPC